MPEPKEICELLIRLWAEQNNQTIASMEIKKGKDNEQKG